MCQCAECRTWSGLLAAGDSSGSHVLRACARHKCCVGVPARRVPDVIRASGGVGLVCAECRTWSGLLAAGDSSGSHVLRACARHKCCVGVPVRRVPGAVPGFWRRGTRRGVVWRRSERLSRCGPRRRWTMIANETAIGPTDLFALKPTTVAQSYRVASCCRGCSWRRWMPLSMLIQNLAERPCKCAR